MPEGTVDHPPGSALIPVATPAGLEASPTVEALGLEEHGLSQRALVWRRFRRHKLAMASLVALLLIGLAVALAPVLTPYNFSDQHLDRILQGPSAKHLLGTDQLGRDELTRLLYGGRVSLLVGLGVALVSAVVGTLAGAAARAIGSSNARIIFRHMLPNALGVIIVNVTLTVAIAILTESLLSFLGFGIQPPTPTWGNMLEDGRSLMTIAGWLVWFPGLAILVTVLCVNFLGDGLRDALDPTQRRVRA